MPFLQLFVLSIGERQVREDYDSVSDSVSSSVSDSVSMSRTYFQDVRSYWYILTAQIRFTLI